MDVLARSSALGVLPLRPAALPGERLCFFSFLSFSPLLPRDAASCQRKHAGRPSALVLTRSVLKTLLVLM